MCFSYSKEQLFFTVNLNYNTFFNLFFYLITELGSTWTYLVIILYSLFCSRRFTLMLLVGLLISTIFAQGLKHFVFDDALRPLEYFKDTAVIHHLSISNSLRFHSFPSGHSVSVFTLISIIIVFLPQRKFDVLLLFTGFLVAYSRVYLGQHFVGDVVFGSLLGVVSGAMVVYLFQDETKLIKPFMNWKSTTSE
ncbi:MAG: phosphatase PAP2 family protein [Bacteroidetes bacterium]|nr:phosphatase PAP2 family protein [Bacteroidota bacterium]